MRRTYRTLNDCEMQHNAEVGLFTKLSKVNRLFFVRVQCARREDNGVFTGLLPKSKFGEN